MRARIYHLVRGSFSAVNLAVAAAVLVWVTGAIESFSNLPFWILAAAMAAALAVGVVKDSDLRAGRLLGALGFVALVGSASYLVTHWPGDGSEAPRAPLVAVLGGVRASLEVRNQTLGGGWGETIEADGSDELQFRLVVENPASTPSSSVVIRVLARENDEEPREIDICFARTESGAMEEGPIVKVIAQSNGLGEFTSRRPQIGFPSRVATRLISLGGENWETEGSSFRAEDYTVPALSAHQRMVITFAGSFEIPRSGQIGGGSLELKNLTEHQHEFESVTSARPGDVIQASYMVFNSGFRSVNAFARVRIASRKGGLFDRVSIFMRENEGEESEHGHGLVNASGSKPVELSVIPGTTELRGAPTECSEETRRPLPDGLTNGGLELGPIGGFEPHDPCHSSNLIRWLFFRLKARAPSPSSVH